jgi:plastocyanin
MVAVKRGICMKIKEWLRVGLIVGLIGMIAGQSVFFNLPGPAADPEPVRAAPILSDQPPAAQAVHTHSALEGAAPRPNLAGAGATIQFGGLLGAVYQPSDVHIRPGQTVNWQGDFTFHPLVSEDGLWTTVSTGSTFTQTFNTPGVFNFHCFVHGAFGMTGKVMVDKAVIYLPVADR